VFHSGIIYRLDLQNHSFSVLYDFGATPSDGLGPQGGLMQATDGKFYGSTTQGGRFGYGSLFQITSAGVYSQLYSFPIVQGVSDQTPVAPPTQETNGTFFGLTQTGGNNGLGSVYTLNMGLGPFIAFVTPSGKVGSRAQILGQSLTGTTSVTFNGLAASSFSVISDTYITAVVPVGATTGPVVVATPEGSLSSNVNFRVSQ
jgi:uncharacterized repeat protein (TIGR03803 family)